MAGKFIFKTNKNNIKLKNVKKKDILFEVTKSNIKLINFKRENIKQNQVLTNFKRKNIPFKLKEKYNGIIPKNLFTCWHTKNLPYHMNKNYNLLKNLNPEFNHFLFDEDECIEFIEKHFPIDVLNAYKSLVPCAYKSDLWRYCVLYINGGIYLDIKYVTVNGFKLIALTEKEHFVRDLDSSFNGIYNALIVSLPRNKILMNCINKIVTNVNNKYYGPNCLAVTGPSLLSKFFTNKQRLKMQLYLEVCKVENVIDTFYICWNNNIILGKYNEYYDEQTKFQKNLRYSELWSNRAIYNI
jgi:mannosyltransferase OCH1-like enzyme